MAYDFPNAPTVGQVYSGYVWDGEKWISTTTPSPPNESGVIAIKVYTASGQYTPSANMTTCVIECVGGGGGGGGVVASATTMYAGAGGGSGGYSKKYATAATIGISQVVTVGAGGTAGTAGNTTGGSGLTTSLGTLCTANGGTGGRAGTNTQAPGAGPGGVAGTGDVAAAGQPGGPGFYNAVNAQIYTGCGNGGSSAFGGGGALAYVGGNAAFAGVAGSNYGGGGGGAIANSTTNTAIGGPGSPGLVIVTEYGMTALSSASAQQGSVRYDLPQGLTASQTAQARANIWVTKRNFLINGAFQINQGVYVSAAVLAAAAYGHDQWKAGASGGDYSFTQSTGSTTITIAAGKSLIQPIEDVRVVGGGSYVLAWTGTAQARAGVNTLTPSGSYAASPLLITGQTDGTVMSVEFNTGTLGSVGLYEGNVAPPFQLPDYAEELRACQRYWQICTLALEITNSASAGVVTAGAITFAPRMRGTPTIALGTPNLTANFTGPTSLYPSTNGCAFQGYNTAMGRGYWYGAPAFNARL